jgi:hypothetical protein
VSDPHPGHSAGRIASAFAASVNVADARPTSVPRAVIPSPFLGSAVPGGGVRLGGPDLFKRPPEQPSSLDDTSTNAEHLTSLCWRIRIVLPKRARDWQRFNAIPKPNDCPGIGFELQSCMFVVHLYYRNI